MPRDLSNQQFKDVDFSDQDLTEASTYSSTFENCTFKVLTRANTSKDGALKPVRAVFKHCRFIGADLSYANFYKSSFVGADFQDANLYETCFVGCNMQYMNFCPKDAFGISFSFTCNTFKNAKIAPFYYLGWFILANSMTMLQQPRVYPVNMQESVIAAIGAERYSKLKALFGREI